jgi:NAD(P)H-hydrate epimerase
LQFVKGSPLPLVIDADALQAEIVAAGTAPRILTPHAGEYERIQLRIAPASIVVRKGPLTRIETGVGGAAEVSVFGGPALARGGSGDMLAGLTAGLLAQAPEDAAGAAARGLVWHGLAADAMARKHGQVAIHTTQLLDFLGPVLRE